MVRFLPLMARWWLIAAVIATIGTIVSIKLLY